jgi:hypothetical protein
MNFESARAAIHGRLETYMNASYAGTKVQYTNREMIDFATHKAPFVACDILWVDGQQASMEFEPIVRRLGAVWFHVGVKMGAGTAGALSMLSAITKQFEIQSFGGLVTQAGQPLGGFERNGWWYERVRVPFYFDEFPAQASPPPPPPPHVLTLGQVSETDFAQAVSRAKRRVLGQASEADTAQPVARYVPFMVFDDFERANQNPLTGNWQSQVIPGVWGNAFLSGGDLIADVAGGPAYWTANQPEADQWAAFVPNATWTHGGVVCRLIPGAGTCYLLVATAANSLLLYRWKNTGVVGLATIGPPSNLIPMVDEVMLEVVTVDANTVRLSVYVNNVLIYVYNDADSDRLLAAGYVGANARGAGGIMSWRAGNVSQNTQGLLVILSQGINIKPASGTSASFVVPPYCDAVVANWSAWGSTDDGNVMSSLSLSVDGAFPAAIQEVPKSGGNSNIGVAIKTAPTYGSQTVSWAHSINTAKNDAGLSLLFLRGVKQSDPYRATQIAQTAGTTDCEATVTSAARDYVLEMCANFNTFGVLPGAPLLQTDPLGNRLLTASKLNAVSAATTCTMTNESYPDLTAISLKPAIRPPASANFYASDDFERASLGSTINWAQDNVGTPWAGQTVQLVGGVAKSVNPSVSAIAYWSAAQPLADQWAAAVIEGVFDATHQYPGVCARLTPGVGTCYFLMCANATDVYLYRYDAGTQVGLAVIHPSDVGLSNLAAGDEVMLEVITLDANTVRLSVYKNNVFIGKYDDLSANRITNAGYVGVHVWGDAGVRSWRAGDVAGNRQGLLVLLSQSFAITAASGTTAAFEVPPYTDAVVPMWSDWGGGSGNVMSALTLGGVSLLPAIQEIAESDGPIVSNIGIGLKTAPASGSKTASWTWSVNSAKSNAVLTLVFVRGVRQANPYRGAVITQSDASTDCSITIDSAVGETVLGFLHNLGGATFPDGMLVHSPGGVGGRNPYVNKQDGAGTVTFTMTFENYPSMAAISLKPV